MEKNVEEKKGGFVKKTLKTVLLIGVGVGAGYCIAKPEKSKEAFNKVKGLFSKKDVAQAVEPSVDPETGIIGDNISELDAAKREDRREWKDRGGYNNNRGFNRH